MGLSLWKSLELVQAAVLAVNTLQQVLGWLANVAGGNFRKVIAKLIAVPC